MSTILLSKPDIVYLQKCAVELGLSFGIIIGQLAEPGKYIVVHLAKNCEEDVELVDKSEEGEHVTQGPHNLEDIDTNALASQWVSACKMCSGSFNVLGVFVTGVKADIIEEHTFKVAKKLLYDLHNLLMPGCNFVGYVDDGYDLNYLFLAYSTAAKKAVCKLYSHNTNGGTLSSMDCRTVEKPFEWYTFECCYEVDDIFPILDEMPKINIEHQFQRTIAMMRRSLAASEIFFQQENIDDSQTLEAYVKKKNANRKKEPEDTFKATIFLPLKCQLSPDYPVRVRKFNGTIRFAGVISSRIWCNSKNKLADVKRFMREDILRSLAARIQVYCDGLTDPLVSNEAIFISEPPRRVYFSVPSGVATNPIQFSEYIFRGEAPTVAVAQAKQVLDVDISTENIVTDLEGLPEDEAFLETSSTESTARPSAASTLLARDLTRTMYMLGIAVALLVLLVSILLHFVLRQ